MLKLFRNRKGAALIEYALLTAGVALVAAGAVSIFGHKTSDMMAATAAIMPGAHGDDNGPIVSGKLIETAANADGNLTIDFAGIATNAGNSRLGDNLGIAAADMEALVVEAGEDP